MKINKKRKLTIGMPGKFYFINKIANIVWNRCLLLRDVTAMDCHLLCNFEWMISEPHFFINIVKICLVFSGGFEEIKFRVQNSC